MNMTLDIPNVPGNVTPHICVMGIGGAGSNAVNNMIRMNLQGVHFIVANTDAQALAMAETDNILQLGLETTSGLGAGSRPDIGKHAAEESMDAILAKLEGSNMLFITAGMGGGTGTGAAPAIAQMARERGILTVAVVTKPFLFEGAQRMQVAEAGLAELEQSVDTLIVIPNENLLKVADEKTTFADAFRMADDVLHKGVKGVTDLMVMPGLINLDFADVKTVMSEMGKAMMGTGEAEGENRAIKAAEAAISNPLLEDSSMKGAKGLLINVTGSLDMTLYEVDEAANRIKEEVDPEANIIFGSIFDATNEGKIRISVVATGIASTGKRIERPIISQPLSNLPKIKTQAAISLNTPPEQKVEEPIPAAPTILKPTMPLPTPSAPEPMVEEPAPLPVKEEIDPPHNFAPAAPIVAPTPAPSLPEEDEDIVETTQTVETIETVENDNAEIANDTTPPPSSTHNATVKAPSLFERMATGLANKSAKPEPEQQTLFTTDIQISEVQENDGGNDYLDIPTFLRRKKG
ncbi:MAG: cell division protein FtsZ [Alphaproteobacteria bacterium]